MMTASPVAEILGLGATVRSMRDLDAAVSAGFPKQTLVRLSVRLYRDSRVASAFKFQVVPVATWKRRSKRLSPQESGRIERFARVLAAAEYALDDREDARVWMTTPHQELEERSPLEVAKTEIGARRVESILNKLIFGLPA